MVDYLAKKTLTQAIDENKQKAKRFYGKHQYFTTRAWNVVQAYIKNFSEPGDVVLDPFGGSGVTAVEALILGRAGIHVDISPLSTFLARTTAYSPTSISAIENGFSRVEKLCEKQIGAWWALSDNALAKTPIEHKYPKDIRLPRNADVEYVHELFTPRQLISLAILKHAIMQEKDEIVRDILLLVFSATLIKTNRMFVSAKGRKPSRGGATIFSMYRHYVPPQPVELHVWEQFKLRYRGVLRAKTEINDLVGTKYNDKIFQAITGSATRLTDYMRPESVDYIFTDPPYGEHIAYLDLSTMFHAWLDLDVTDGMRQDEAIEGGDLQKSQDDYFDLMNQSFEQMFQVLKFDRWMSVVFAHKDVSYWNAIVNGAKRAGFEYVNSVPQSPQTVWSMHKKKNPLKVLAGNMILTFRKTTRPTSVAVSFVGADAVEIMKNTAELVIVRNEGSATTDQVIHEIVVKLLENGLLREVKTKVGDIAPLLQEYFVFNEIDETWHIPKNVQLGQFIPLDERVRFYMIDYLNRADRQGETVTFDAVAYNVLPELINGETPDNQTILSILQEIAHSPDGLHWKLSDLAKGKAQYSLLDIGKEAYALPEIIMPVSEEGVTHNSIVYRLAKLGKAAGYAIWIGKQEQRDQFNGEKLADLSVDQLPLDGVDEYSVKAIEQIDVIWLEQGTNRLVYGFEVEHSTTIKSGIQRFIEALKANPDLAGNLIIFAPSKRKRKLIKELTQSAFIGHPMYMENKIRYGYYTDLLKLYESLSKSAFKSTQLGRKLDAILNTPKL